MKLEEIADERVTLDLVQQLCDQHQIVLQKFVPGDDLDTRYKLHFGSGFCAICDNLKQVYFVLQNQLIPAFVFQNVVNMRYADGRASPQRGALGRYVIFDFAQAELSYHVNFPIYTFKSSNVAPHDRYYNAEEFLSLVVK